MANATQERERAAEEEEQRETDIALGNPLLNSQDFNMKRRWDDDVVFKNQARGTENRDGKEFVNVCPYHLAFDTRQTTNKSSGSSTL